MKKQTFYIIYKYDKKTNDIINIYDFDKLKDASNYLNIDYSNVNKYILKNIDDNISSIKLKNDMYFIYKDIIKDF